MNALLGALPPDEYHVLERSLESIPVPAHTILYEPDEPIGHVHFPDTGVLSLLALDHSGGAVEVGTIGNEGTSGLPVFHGQMRTTQQCLAQVAGNSRRIPSAEFAGLLPRLPSLAALLHRYAQCFFNDVAQSVACARLHSIEQRFARWLLMTHDRVDGDDFVLTQDFLSFMIGTRRGSVSAVASQLRQRRLLSYSRGRITILDRDGLENTACECYRITRTSYDELLAKGTRELHAS